MKQLNKASKVWQQQPFTCIGAAHIDTITELVAPAVRNRTNPIHRTIRRPGGVACNIAAALVTFDCPVTLYSPKPPNSVSDWMREHNIKHRQLGTKSHNCSYTAVLEPSGELELGLADMEDYDRMGKDCIPASFPGKKPGMLIIDAAFKPTTHKSAAQQARSAGWLLCGTGTSPAKVKRLAKIPFDLFVVNEAEAEVFLGRKSTAAKMARSIAATTRGWVAVTMGSKGACLAFADRHFVVKPSASSSRNTIGAGDVFTAALAAAWTAVHAGIWEPEQALEFAVTQGYRHVSKKLDKSQL